MNLTFLGLAVERARPGASQEPAQRVQPVSNLPRSHVDGSDTVRATRQVSQPRQVSRRSVYL